MNKRLLPRICKNLKKIAGYGAGGAMALVLAGCASTPVTSSMTAAQQAQATANLMTHQYQECVVYKASQPIIAKKVETLPIAAATTLYDASVQATRYCGTVFTNTPAQQTLLAQALTTVAMEAGINYAIQAGGAK